MLLILTRMSETDQAYTFFANSINYGQKLGSTVYERNPSGFAVAIASVDGCCVPVKTTHIAEIQPMARQVQGAFILIPIVASSAGVQHDTVKGAMTRAKLKARVSHFRCATVASRAVYGAASVAEAESRITASKRNC